ncbi:BrnT family toxin [Sphingobium limneticum]|jgi:uncharacterized DUF497 family protein
MPFPKALFKLGQKDGQRFSTARAFLDPARSRTLGLVEGHLLLLVAHTVVEQDDDGEYVEIIHIISARKADRTERRRYEEERR